MPPKPFNPPRPSTSTSKAKGRPKGSINKSKSNVIPVPKPKPKTSISGNGVKKASVGKGKGKENRESGGRESLSERYRGLLPSLSPDTGDEEEDVEMRDGARERDAEESDDPFASQPKRNPAHDIEEDADEERNTLPTRKQKIPEDLLAVLLNQFFKHEGSQTRMSRQALRAVGMYVDTFVREGVARAAWMGDEDENGRGGRGEVLEVEDLERCAPQLLLDF